jgi:hypothetical protein
VTIERLRRDGIAVLPAGLTLGQVVDVRAYLKTRPAYSSHVRVYSDGVARSWHEAAEMFDVWCHAMEDAILAPHVLELALSYVPLMRDYLGQPPLLYSMNAFWSRGGVEPLNPAIQAWHRDNDDTRFCAIFVYGTDVLDDAHGPHRFRAGTHVGGGIEDGPEVVIYGPAGTAFAAHTHGMHMGGKPTADIRLLMWARFGVSDPPESYRWDKLEPIDATRLGDRYPTDPRLRDVIKLVVR